MVSSSPGEGLAVVRLEVDLSRFSDGRLYDRRLATIYFVI